MIAALLDGAREAGGAEALQSADYWQNEMPLSIDKGIPKLWGRPSFQRVGSYIVS